MKRAFTNILSNDVEETAGFYQELLGMKRAGDFGWFIVLSHDEMPEFELGILNKYHDTIPRGLSSDPAGCIFTFVVSDLEEVNARAISMQTEILQEPTDLPYGQRRLMFRDPSGSIVDVSSPIC
ncbi:VOC family protein [Loktanella agnita]|uniref:VOC family protein n=1 Tax=Loktanella agnita TaxID=287097 RepID=UPI0039896D56